MISSECIERHDLFDGDRALYYIHWTGVHFSPSFDDETIDAAILEIIKLVAGDAERLKNRWADFKDAQKFQQQMLDWLRTKIGPSDADDFINRGKEYISNFSRNGCWNEWKFTDLVPIAMQQRWADGVKITKEVYDDYAICIVNHGEDGTERYELKRPNE